MKADEEGYAVPALAYYTAPTSSARVQGPPPGSNRYYEASALCMSRNRDLDGDGRISPDEVRWYLPAEGKYERIMLGRNSLATPIFSVSNGLYYTNPNDEVAMENNNWGYDGAIGSGNDNQVQFISSDHMKFFLKRGVHIIGTYMCTGLAEAEDDILGISAVCVTLVLTLLL